MAPAAKKDKLAFMSFIVEVDVSTPKWAKIVMNIINSMEGVSNCLINEDGMVEVSGTVDPGSLMKKLAKAGKKAHVHFLKFGKCSSNLFLPPADFNANYHYGSGSAAAHTNNINFGYGRGNHRCGGSNYYGPPPTAYNNINGDNRHLHFTGHPPPPHGRYHQHHHRGVMAEQSVTPPAPPIESDEGGGIINCCTVM